LHFYRATSQAIAMAWMSLAHVFTGYSPDLGNVRRSWAKQAVKISSLKKETSKKQPFVNESQSRKSPSASCVQQKKLQDAEDDRWLDVEGGSPTTTRWRSCSGCAFLNAASAPACEVCGMRMTGQDSNKAECSSDVGDASHDQQYSQETAFSGCNNPRRYTSRERRAAREALTEVVVADTAPLAEGLSAVSRHNMLFVVFKALHRGRGLLRPEDFERFSQLVGFPVGGASWAQNYVDLAAEYGWEPMKGAHLGQFLRCVDDIGGQWYCPTGTLWTLLSRLDRQDRLSGNDCHTAAALQLGRSALDIDLTTGLPPVREAPHIEEEEDADSDSDCSSDGEPIPGTLEEAPAIGTKVKVLYDDDIWYTAVTLSANGAMVGVEYECGSLEELDLDVFAVRLFDYVEEDDDSEEDASASDAGEDNEQSNMGSRQDEQAEDSESDSDEECDEATPEATEQTTVSSAAVSALPQEGVNAGEADNVDDDASEEEESDDDESNADGAHETDRRLPIVEVAQKATSHMQDEEVRTDREDQVQMDDQSRTEVAPPCKPASAATSESDVQTPMPSTRKIADRPGSAIPGRLIYSFGI